MTTNPPTDEELARIFTDARTPYQTTDVGNRAGFRALFEAGRVSVTPEATEVKDLQQALTDTRTAMHKAARDAEYHEDYEIPGYWWGRVENQDFGADYDTVWLPAVVVLAEHLDDACNKVQEASYTPEVSNHGAGEQRRATWQEIQDHLAAVSPVPPTATTELIAEARTQIDVLHRISFGAPVATQTIWDAKEKLLEVTDALEAVAALTQSGAAIVEAQRLLIQDGHPAEALALNDYGTTRTQEKPEAESIRAGDNS